MDFMTGLKRTMYCGQPRLADAGREITVAGWVQRQRDLGALIFIDLRDRTGILHELSCAPERTGCYVDRDPEHAILNDIVNCCIYPIESPLSYNDDVRDALSRQRLRFDGMTLFPEAMNNEIRLKLSGDVKNQDVYIPVTGIPDPYDGKFTAGFFYCLEIDLILPRRYIYAK